MATTAREGFMRSPWRTCMTCLTLRWALDIPAAVRNVPFVGVPGSPRSRPQSSPAAASALEAEFEGNATSLWGSEQVTPSELHFLWETGVLITRIVQVCCENSTRQSTRCFGCSKASVSGGSC